jgi:hypothetical protein
VYSVFGTRDDELLERTIVHTILFLKASAGGGLITLLNAVSSWNCFPV